MKKKILIGIIACVGLTSAVVAQDLLQSDVPSVVVNNFQKAFPKAFDVEWELKGELYEVDFETGVSIDHEAWYDKTGKLVKHKQEIAKTDLPKAVLNTLNTDFKGYRVEDAKKITEGSKVTYKLDLESTTSEWKVLLSSEGKVLSKIAD
ncbi:MAG TPA: hypothetical protein PLI97_12310 [Fluviicola sp.]|nr:hypothetical protein [Fluviicola sp.]